MSTLPRARKELLAIALLIATSCTLDVTGMSGSTSTSGSSASGGGSVSASSGTSGGGGAGGSSASSAAGGATATATSSATSSSSASSSNSASSSSSSSSSASSGAGGGGGAGGTGPIVAGALLVDLDANDPSAGKQKWNNKGTLGGDFTAQGTPDLVTIGTTKAVTFDGVGEAYVGPLSVPEIEGISDRSIEVWALNPGILDEEPMVSWSDRTGYVLGTMMSFNHGTNLTWGAMTHMHTPDLPWGPAPADVPKQGVWHHLVYTYDGTTARVFADGVMKTEKAVTIATKGGFSINLAAEREGAALNHHASLSLAVVRIHDGALSDADVKANYQAELPRFQ